MRTVHGASSVEVIADGRTEVIDASLVEPVRPGDLVLVHAAVAISNLSCGSGTSRNQER